MIAGKAASLAEGAALAVASIDHGRAEGALERLIHVSNE
jgi:anthranilate phosphoribosyltransferase